jgi:hypothetical protein
MAETPAPTPISDHREIGIPTSASHGMTTVQIVREAIATETTANAVEARTETGRSEQTASPGTKRITVHATTAEPEPITNQAAAMASIAIAIRGGRMPAPPRRDPPATPCVRVDEVVAVN